MHVNDAADNFYSAMTQKNIGVYTAEEQNKLRNSRVIILGLGGVGGMQAILCARAGIGHISGVDPDVFEVSNLNRQMLATVSTLNCSKSATTETHLKDINPYLSTCFQQQQLTEDNAAALLSGHDLVLEALDDMPARIIAHRAAKTLGIPSIAMSGSPPHRGFVSCFLPKGITYEAALNIPTQGQRIADPQVTEFIQNIKKRRATYSVTCGAPEWWANDYVNGKTGWIITPIRANLIAAFSCHEAIQLLMGRSPLAIAPKAVIINLDNLTCPVSIMEPENGYWAADQI